MLMGPARVLVEGTVVRGFEGPDIGDSNRVELVHANVEHGQVDVTRSHQVSPASTEGR